MFIFGLRDRRGAAPGGEGSYRPTWIYEHDARVRRVVDTLTSGLFAPRSPGCSAPARHARRRQRAVLPPRQPGAVPRGAAAASDLSRTSAAWARKALLTISRMGRFSSDRTIQEYADEIWTLRSVPTVRRTEGTRVRGSVAPRAAAQAGAAPGAGSDGPLPVRSHPDLRTDRAWRRWSDGRSDGPTVRSSDGAGPAEPPHPRKRIRRPIGLPVQPVRGVHPPELVSVRTPDRRTLRRSRERGCRYARPTGPTGPGPSDPAPRRPATRRMRRDRPVGPWSLPSVGPGATSKRHSPWHGGAELPFRDGHLGPPAVADACGCDAWRARSERRARSAPWRRRRRTPQSTNGPRAAAGGQGARR